MWILLFKISTFFVSLFPIRLMKKSTDCLIRFFFWVLGGFMKVYQTYMSEQDHFMYYFLIDHMIKEDHFLFSRSSRLIPKRWTRMDWKRKSICSYIISFSFCLMKCAFMYICNTRMYISKELFQIER
jgi:hypothetical protein